MVIEKVSTIPKNICDKFIKFVSKNNDFDNLKMKLKV